MRPVRRPTRRRCLKKWGFIRKDWAVYLGTAVSVPLLALLVGRNELAGLVLLVFGGIAFVFLIVAAFRSEKIERERMFVVLILMFFSMLFWAFSSRPEVP